MAELATGLLGAAATVGAAQLTAASNFTGRHESSQRELIMERKRNTDEFFANLRGGDVTPDEETEFLRTRAEAIQRENEYHESIESYKIVSWFNIPQKLKKRKDVRRGKRLTRETNHTLRNLNESMSSGSDTSSICASSGSPPGSNLAAEEIQDWTHAVCETMDADDNAAMNDAQSQASQIMEPLSDRDHRGHQSVARALDGGSLPDPALLHLYPAPGIPQLIELLEHSDPAVRDLATERFGKSADDSVSRGAMAPGIPTIIKLLGDWECWDTAAELFCQLAAHSVFHEAMKPGIPQIIQLLYKDDWQVRQSAAKAFRELAVHPVFHKSMKQGIPQLVKLLDNSNSLVRQSAADAFRELAAYPVFHQALKPGIPQINKLLDDWKVCQFAADALCNLATHPVFHEAIISGIPQMIKLLDNGNWEVCESSANAFGRLASQRKEKPPVLLSIWQSFSAAFHKAMKLSIPQIIKLLSAAKAFRKLAAYPLFHEYIKPGIPHIIELLYVRNLEVLQSAANVFGELAAHCVFHAAMMPGIPRVMELLADSSFSVRRSAVGLYEKLAEHPVFHEVRGYPWDNQFIHEDVQAATGPFKKLTPTGYLE
ncbi:armadillo-type protein [Mycena leptocephala]|nr:armadillo-type protein [Mycena leptocephala]